MMKTISSDRPTWVILSILSLCPTFTADAVEFAIVGPRAACMGGAGVAVTSDSLATY